MEIIKIVGIKRLNKNKFEKWFNIKIKGKICNIKKIKEQLVPLVLHIIVTPTIDSIDRQLKRHNVILYIKLLQRYLIFCTSEEHKRNNTKKGWEYIQMIIDAHNITVESHITNHTHIKHASQYRVFIFHPYPNHNVIHQNQNNTNPDKILALQHLCNSKLKTENIQIVHNWYIHIYHILSF